MKVTYEELIKKLHKIDEEFRILSLKRKDIITEYNKTRHEKDYFRG